MLHLQTTDKRFHGEDYPSTHHFPTNLALPALDILHLFWLWVEIHPGEQPNFTNQWVNPRSGTRFSSCLRPTSKW